MQLNNIEMTSGDILATIPVVISVLPATLNKELANNYDLFMFTMLSLDPKVSKRNKLLNGQNTVGDYEKQKKDYFDRAQDIADHGSLLPLYQTVIRK